MTRARPLTPISSPSRSALLELVDAVGTAEGKYDVTISGSQPAVRVVSMGKLKVLFIGGSGVISSACARVAVESGIDLYVLNRGQNTTRPLPAGVHEMRADVRNPASVRDAIEEP